MSSSISARLSPLTIRKPREPVDVSNFALNENAKQRLARGETTERQARVDSEVSRIFRDASLTHIEKADRIARVEGNNGDGTNTIRFQNSAEVAEFAQTQQMHIKSSVDMINGSILALTRIDVIRAAVGDETAEAFRKSTEEAIARMRSSLEGDISSLFEYFNVSGDVIKERPDGQGYDLGSYALSYQSDAASVLLRTADYPAPATEETKDYSLVQLLDGVVRERTDRTRPGSGVDRRA
jgi:hypothetical protein